MNKIQPQLELFPSFIGNLPTKPYCTNDLATGLKIRPKNSAISFKYIQPNSPFYQHYFVLDLDYESAMSEILYSLDGIPMPNFVAETPNSGRLHAFLSLKHQFIQQMQVDRSQSCSQMPFICVYSNFSVLMLVTQG